MPNCPVLPWFRDCVDGAMAAEPSGGAVVWNSLSRTDNIPERSSDIDGLWKTVATDRGLDAGPLKCIASDSLGEQVMATLRQNVTRWKIITVLVAATMSSAGFAHAVQATDEESKPTKPGAPKSLLATLPKPGKIVESKKGPFDITNARLDNGVLVHHRFLDGEKGFLMAVITLAGGEIEETKENAGITQAAFLTINAPETSRLTKSNVRSLLVGKKLKIGASANDDAVTIEFRSSVKDFETGLQLLHAMLTDGQLSAATFEAWRAKGLKNFVSYRPHVFWNAHNAADDLLCSSDPRRTAFDDKRLKSVKRHEAHAWYQRMCRQAPMEVSVVGDMKLDVALPLIQRYLGSLPKRPATAAHLKPLRRTEPLKGPVSRVVEYDAATSWEALVIAGLHGFDPHNTSDLRALQLATVLLDRRQLALRDRSKLTPSIRAQFRPNWSFDDASNIMTIARCTPKNGEKLAMAIFRTWDRFAKLGTNKKELDDVKRQVKAGYVQAENDMSYWARTLGCFDLNRRNIQDERDIANQLDAVTPAELLRVFKKYYTPENRYQVITIPKKSAGKKEAKDKDNGKP